MERVCLFIDGSNFSAALKRNVFPTRVDLHELSKALAGPERELVRTYYYHPVHDPVSAADLRKAQQPFLDSLAKTPGLEPRLGRLVAMKEGGFREKGTDVLMSEDLVYCAAKNTFDTALVITEDPEFSYAIKLAKNLGKHIKIVLFKDAQPRELLVEADAISYMDNLLKTHGSKIFLEEEEDNFGNRTEDQTLSRKKDPKPGLNGRLKKLLG